MPLKTKKLAAIPKSGVTTEHLLDAGLKPKELTDLQATGLNLQQILDLLVKFGPQLLQFLPMLLQILAMLGKTPPPPVVIP
jgi:hypothetical protein